MKKLASFCLLGSMLILAASANAASCQISRQTASELLSLRNGELASPVWEQSILRTLQNDRCVDSKNLQSEELEALVNIVTDLDGYSDQSFVGEINEYLNM